MVAKGRRPVLTAAVLTIAVVWLALRVVYGNGYYVEDAPGYVTDAISTALGHAPIREYVNGMNVGTYVPVALPIKLLGKSEVALSVWPLACSLLGVVSLGGAAAILFGPWFGVLAAFLYATYPGDVFFSTVVMPDSIQAGWLSLSMFLIVQACTAPTAGKPLGLVCAGIAMGVCYLIRANGAILFPVGLSGVALLSSVGNREERGAILRSCLAYSAGCVIVITLEGLIYLFTKQDFLLRFHVLNEHYGALTSINQHGLNTDPRTIPFSVFAPVVWWLRGGWGRLDQEQAYHALTFFWAGVFLFCGIAASVALKTSRSSSARAGLSLAAVWFAWPIAYHEFGSQSFTQFVPIHRLSRQLVVYAPGAIFAIVAGCVALTGAARSLRPNGRRILVAVGSLVLIVQCYFNWAGTTIAYDAFHRIKATYIRIREHLPGGRLTIIADPGDFGFIDFWMNPLGRPTVKMVPFSFISGCHEIPPGVVFTYSNPGWEHLSALAIQEATRRLPCLVHPPPTWKLLYDGFPEKLYVSPSIRAP